MERLLSTGNISYRSGVVVIDEQPEETDTIMQRYFKLAKRANSLLTAWLVVILLALVCAPGRAQTRKDIFQPGEQLVYTVKYGFITLGTVVIQTGSVSPAGIVKAHMEFWTANIPFLNNRTNVTDQFATNDITIRTFEQHSQSGNNKSNKYASYDPAAKTLTYSDDSVTNDISHNIEPYDDALGILFNMRAWSGAVGHKYIFHVRDRAGARPVTLTFTNQLSDQSVPALGDKTISTRVVNGMMDLGNSAPLGADGAITAYISNDEAAVPVRIDMSIAVGSISLVLDKIKRAD
ncbi:MAG TPA: DUF3108 domain-containing protein, partial [Candidatus Kapabacteria bacterium]|nr:DUF3108 domain-containing protein [Candidatus Kapabacteria bacterium]